MNRFYEPDLTVDVDSPFVRASVLLTRNAILQSLELIAKADRLLSRR
jgi:hypothetical protein